MDEQTRVVYAQAGLGHPLPRGTKPAVLVVDLVYGFTDPECVLGAELGDVVSSTRRILDTARGRGLLTLFTTVQYQVHLADCGLWLHKMPGLEVLRAGRREVEVDTRLGRTDKEPLIVKKGPSAFFGTNLASILISQRVDTVVLCGATTSGCIRASAVDLLQYVFPLLFRVRRSGIARGRHTRRTSSTSTRNTPMSCRSRRYCDTSAASDRPPLTRLGPDPRSHRASSRELIHAVLPQEDGRVRLAPRGCTASSCSEARYLVDANDAPPVRPGGAKDRVPGKHAPPTHRGRAGDQQGERPPLGPHGQRLLLSLCRAALARGLGGLGHHDGRVDPT